MSCQSEIEKILTKIPSIPAGLHIYLRGPCHVDLRVEDDHILFPKEHVAVGDQRAAVSLDKDDDGPSGDIQLLDALTDPGMIFLEHHFLELNAFALVVVEGLSSQYHGVPGFHHHVSPGDDDLVIPLDGSHNDPGREVELGDGLSCPLVLVGQMNLNEMDVRLLAVLTHPLDAGILIHESRGNDTGGDGHNTHAQEGDKDAEHFPKDSDGVNVAVAYSEQGGGSPPDPGESVGEHFRLGLVLQAVHAQAGGQHQHEDDENGRKKLLLFAHNDFRDHIQRVVVGIDAEQAEDPYDPEHAEGDGSRREKEGEILGQKGQKVHNACKGSHIFQNSPGLSAARVQIFCRPYAEKIIHHKKSHSGLLYGHQQTAVSGPVLFKCVDHADYQIENDAESIKKVIDAADIVVLCPYLYDLENSLSALFPCALHPMILPAISLHSYFTIYTGDCKREKGDSCPLETGEI